MKPGSYQSLLWWNNEITAVRSRKMLHLNGHGHLVDVELMFWGWGRSAVVIIWIFLLWPNVQCRSVCFGGLDSFRLESHLWTKPGAVNILCPWANSNSQTSCPRPITHSSNCKGVMMWSLISVHACHWGVSVIVSCVDSPLGLLIWVDSFFLGTTFCMEPLISPKKIKKTQIKTKPP